MLAHVLDSCKHIFPGDESQELTLYLASSYLTGHGVPEKVIDQGFAQAKTFFDLPLEEKEKIDIHNSANMKGYTKLKGENVDPANRGDMHEGFDIGGEDALFAGATGSANQWPSDLPGFQENVLQYWDAAYACFLISLRLSDFRRTFSSLQRSDQV
jgi:isopenicillin N synthase-like dioxygenase